MTAPGPDVVVLAHGGGADEAVLVGLPLLVLVVFAVLERRARRREAASEHQPVDEDETGGG